MMVAAREGLVPTIGRQMLDDVTVFRAQFGVGYEHPERLTEETARTYLQPFFATPEAVKHLERFILALDNRHTVAIEPLLRKLQAPTLVVWGTADIFFDVRWAYWLRDTIPGCRRVVEIPGAKLFVPEERPDELVAAMRELWGEAERAAVAGGA
jgi:pimeloyl-ACP methyl ester carboxylesterase